MPLLLRESCISLSLSPPMALNFYEILLLIGTVVGFTTVTVKLLRWRREMDLDAPIATTIFHLLYHFDDRLDYATQLSRRYKTFRMWVPGRSQILTVDPAVIEYVLKTNFPNFGKGDISVPMEELLGDGIFAVDGEKWHHQRKLASFEFSTKVLRDSSVLVFKKNAVKLAHILLDVSIKSEPVEIQDLLMKTTMDSIFKVTFGEDLNCLDDATANNEINNFVKAFDASSELITRRFLNPFWKIARFLKIGSEAEMSKNIKVLDDFVYNLISTKINQRSNKKGHETGQRDDLLSRFILHSEQNQENMNMKYLRDITLSFIIAGKDATAGTLSWFLLMLCKHPFIQEKVSLEVLDATQSANITNFEDFVANLSEEALNKMQYLHASLSETLRLYPNLPIDHKVCFSDDILPNGYRVKKGDIVTYQPYPMGRMEFLWGEDAEDFRPERWLDENEMFKPESSFKFTAFQAGPRICLGKEFAYRQMKVYAAVLLRFFRFHSDKEMAMHYKPLVNLHIEGGLHLRVSLR